jgi:hypothetical protein
VLSGETCELERDGSEWSFKNCSLIQNRIGPRAKPGAALINPVF